MDSALTMVALAFVVAGMALFVWASVRHTNTGIWPRPLMIAGPLCGLIGWALMLGSG
jgi:hypothetical protein